MKIHTISGYEKVGGNMTAVEIGGELVVLDVGADIERVKGEGKSLGDMKRGEAVEKKIVPDDSEIREREEDVVAIIVGHGHLDHCLGIPKLAGAYGCPIIATPFTISVIQRLVGGDREDNPQRPGNLTFRLLTSGVSPHFLSNSIWSLAFPKMIFEALQPKAQVGESPVQL
ncbi:hypothetical protein AKJ37_05765 [candidate division MSBL1 archaeon SCGC-AAA259I09]|uniref:Metallo-beta-lactamase domain-containing protein n=1 Tax=candidate division MSBL1 archaeon SCGC-AAA259I09 TaxID=1698267 RepID=A0A133UPV6_9EURY|nr:hypothetical protein AKJ37_05765 [candidate division MSBL1 archaeon SCGC-AAA259I09]